MKIKSNKRTRMIIFDFDGVIENNYELHYELSKKKITGLTREEHRQLFEGNIHVQREKLNHRNTEFDMKTHFINAKKKLIVKPEIKKELIKLAQKYTLGIITSAKEYGVQDYLKANGMENLFDFVYGFETHKIKVDKFNMVFKKYNITKDDCFFVTDTLGDIKEANKVGVKTIAVDFGFHERERLEKGNPYALVSQFGKIRETLEYESNISSPMFDGF